MAGYSGGNRGAKATRKNVCMGAGLCLLVAAMVVLSGCIINSGDAVTSTIPSQGGAMEINGFAAAAFPPGAFNNSQSVTLERADVTDFNATAKLFSLNQWTDELTISTGSSAPLADTKVSIELSKNFTGRLTGNSRVQAFVRIFQDNGYGFIDAFEPVASIFNSTAVEVTLPKEAFANTRNAKGDYEAVIVVASSESGAANPQADNLGCKAESIGSPLRGNLEIASGPGGRTAAFGVDLKANIGDLVFPVAPGTIIGIGYDEDTTQYPTRLQESQKLKKTGWGQYVMIRNDDGASVLYANLAKNSPQALGLKTGQKVNTCTQIGTIGSTGGATGPYLHLEYVVNGSEIYPWPCMDKGVNSCKAQVFCESWQEFNKKTGKCDIVPGYCNSNKDCKLGQECGVSTRMCQNTKGNPGMTRGKLSCPTGFVLGLDNLCHSKCGTGYCADDQQCYNSQCLSCSKGYLMSGGLCYSDTTGNTGCPDGYAAGQDGYCHEKCGQNICSADAWCYNDVCVTCQLGQYLGTDGYCHESSTQKQVCPDGYAMDAEGLCPPENGGEDYQCPPGEVPGNDFYCHKACGDGYCEGGAQCYGGQCLICEAGYYLGTDGKCHLENGGGLKCPDEYILGNDGLCHKQCGTGYCEGNQQCYNNKCTYCYPDYYLAVDGNCYFNYADQVGVCGQGFVLGSDLLCHEQCGNGYCQGDAQCYGGQCISCLFGYYLGTDGKCHLENGGCEIGNVIGEDGLCHMHCGDSYCIGDEECYADECRSCGVGEVMGFDGQCHEACGTGYCGFDAVCVDGSQCIGCNSGYVLGTDGQCHEACGDGYCTGDSACINGQCLGCIEGEVLGTDGMCYEACGDSYCTGGGMCINGECSECISGFTLGGDGQCYENCGNGYCPPTEVCRDGGCVDPNQCSSQGQILGDDGYCHEKCGSGYCTEDTICEYGQCVPDCPYGEVLGNDGQCHEACGNGYCTGTDRCEDGQCQPGCPEGQVMGADGACHEACGSTYCVGDTVCENGQCTANCQPGEILGGNGICYPGCPLGSFQASDSLCCMNGEHAVTPTGCCPNGMDLSNDPRICCPSGDYYTGEGLICCPYGTTYDGSGRCMSPQQQEGSSG